jgi:hypothetical protein
MAESKLRCCCAGFPLCSSHEISKVGFSELHKGLQSQHPRIDDLRPAEKVRIKGSGLRAQGLGLRVFSSRLEQLIEELGGCFGYLSLVLSADKSRRGSNQQNTGTWGCLQAASKSSV